MNFHYKLVAYWPIYLFFTIYLWYRYLKRRLIASKTRSCRPKLPLQIILRLHRSFEKNNNEKKCPLITAYWQKRHQMNVRIWLTIDFPMKTFNRKMLYTLLHFTFLLHQQLKHRQTTIVWNNCSVSFVSEIVQSVLDKISNEIKTFFRHWHFSHNEMATST